jgi:hypothetical protein
MRQVREMLGEIRGEQPPDSFYSVARAKQERGEGIDA